MGASAHVETAQSMYPYISLPHIAELLLSASASPRLGRRGSRAPYRAPCQPFQPHRGQALLQQAGPPMRGKHSRGGISMALTSSGKTRKRFPTRSWTPQPLAGWRLLGLLALVGLFLGGLVGTAVAKPNVLKEPITFDMVPSAAAQTGNCLSGAIGHVTVTSLGPVEVMNVVVTGLPPNTEFDLFVIQLPNAPFGLPGNQADIEPTGKGVGTRTSTAPSRF